MFLSLVHSELECYTVPNGNANLHHQKRISSASIKSLPTLLQSPSLAVGYGNLTLMLSLVGKNTPSSVFKPLKISVRSCSKPFMIFPEYEMGTKCNSQIVDQCTGNC